MWEKELAFTEREAICCKIFGRGFAWKCLHNMKKSCHLSFWDEKVSSEMTKQKSVLVFSWDNFSLFVILKYCNDFQLLAFTTVVTSLASLSEALLSIKTWQSCCTRNYILEATTLRKSVLCFDMIFFSLILYKDLCEDHFGLLHLIMYWHFLSGYYNVIHFFLEISFINFVPEFFFFFLSFRNSDSIIDNFVSNFLFFSYFPYIFNKSGGPAAVAQYGDWFTYDKNPRALIFKRDVGKVTDLTSMTKLMRYIVNQFDKNVATSVIWPYNSKVTGMRKKNSPE